MDSIRRISFSESEDSLQYFSGIDSAFAVLSKTGHIEYCSDEFLELTGISSHIELAKQKIHISEFIKYNNPTEALDSIFKLDELCTCSHVSNSPNQSCIWTGKIDPKKMLNIHSTRFLISIEIESDAELNRQNKRRSDSKIEVIHEADQLSFGVDSTDELEESNVIDLEDIKVTALMINSSNQSTKTIVARIKENPSYSNCASSSTSVASSRSSSFCYSSGNRSLSTSNLFSRNSSFLNNNTNQYSSPITTARKSQFYLQQIFHTSRNLDMSLSSLSDDCGLTPNSTPRTSRDDQTNFTPQRLSNLPQSHSTSVSTTDITLSIQEGHQFLFVTRSEHGNWFRELQSTFTDLQQPFQVLTTIDQATTYYHTCAHQPRRTLWTLIAVENILDSHFQLAKTLRDLSISKMISSKVIAVLIGESHRSIICGSIFYELTNAQFDGFLTSPVTLEKLQELMETLEK